MPANKTQARILREEGLTVEELLKMGEKEMARKRAILEVESDESDQSSVPPARRVRRAGTDTTEPRDTPSTPLRKSVSIESIRDQFIPPPFYSRSFFI